MEEVPDMDDLLDEMESDLIRKARSSQPLPLLPPTSIGMQPRGFHQNPPDAVIVSKYVPNEDMNEQLEGHIEIDTSKLPNIFKPKNVIWQKQESNSNETTPMFPTKTNGTHQAEVQPEIEKEVVKVVQSEPEPEELEPEPEPEYVSEAEEDEDTIVPETQIISSFNVTDRDLTAQVVQKPDKEQLDTEMESMLEYLNGFGNSAVETVIENEAARKPGGRESLSESADESIISQFADTLSEELMESALKQPIKNLHYDPAIKEFYTANDSAPDVFAISLDETQSSSSCDNLSEPESFEKEKDRMPSIDEDEVEEVCGNVSENKEKESEAAIEDDVVEEEKTEPEVSDIEIATTETVEPVLEEVTVESEVQREEENVEKIVGSDIVEPAVVEAVRRESDDFTVDIVPVDHEESSIEPCEEEQSRPRIDSSIATIHVLHESDSDDATTPRRERRLTESELQLGKSSPYWIPDSESPLCMLCNSKFTIITRRHHCRACGRVLCGSCCNEKAILEYLQEEGKKPQAVRVCQPCSAMLARIEAHEHEEKRRRESVTSESDVNHLEDSTSALLPSSVPRGVLKTRSMTQGNDEEGTSTSSQTTSVSGVSTESSKRSVMFRDGVRPGAQGEEANPEDEKSTALKPKKKSRKRQSVVKRIAELKMEDELHSVLPEDGKTRVQILKPGADFPVYENASDVLESLCNFSIVTIMLKRNLSCTVQIFNNPNFGLVWAVSSQGFAQIGLDELLFSWTLNDREKQRVDADEPELDENNASSYIPFSVLRRIALIFKHSTEHEFAGVRRVGSRLAPVHSDATPEYPLTRNVLFFRPTVQVGLANMRIPTNPFLIACFLHDDELHWSTGLSNRLLYKLGEKYNVFPTPFVNEIGREALYSTDFSGTVLKVFTDFRNWSYRMRHIPGCTVSLTNEKTVIRVPKSALTDLKEVLSFSRSMVAWSVDFAHDDDSVLICEETDTGLYSTQVFAKSIGQRESTSASFVILDGGSKVSSLQVNVVEDGVAIRLQSERLEVILNAINDGHDIVETSKDMEFRVEFVEDGDWISPNNDYFPKSQIDGIHLMNKFQYGLSLERVLTQALPIQGLPDYEVRMSHVYNLGEGRLTPEEEPKIYGMVEIAAKECVNMLEPHIRLLIASGILSVSIRLFVSPYEFEYDVSKWSGLEEENSKYRQSLDQLIPILCNMIDFVPNGFEVEFVLSFVTTRALRN